MINIRIDYDINSDVFCYRTNLKPDRVIGAVGNFIRSQMGAGTDATEPNATDLYEIDIDIDLSVDRFTCRHNCGNLGLRDGIMVRFWQKLMGAK